jgi:uncharacterized protein
MAIRTVPERHLWRAFLPLPPRLPLFAYANVIYVTYNSRVLIPTFNYVIMRSLFWEPCFPGGANLNPQHALRLNVGFLLNKSVGYSRNFDFQEFSLQFGDDLSVTDFNGLARLTRTGQGILVQAKFDGTVAAECVRCLGNFSQSLSAEIDELFTHPPDKADDPQTTISDQAILDLTPMVREVFLIDIPIQPTCTPDCAGLCPHCGENRNEVECSHPEAEIDPRMAVLKTLLSKS